MRCFSKTLFHRLIGLAVLVGFILVYDSFRDQSVLLSTLLEYSTVNKESWVTARANVFRPTPEPYITNVIGKKRISS
jgi:hypothetical protein